MNLNDKQKTQLEESLQALSLDTADRVFKDVTNKPGAMGINVSDCLNQLKRKINKVIRIGPDNDITEEADSVLKYSMIMSLLCKNEWIRSVDAPPLVYVAGPIDAGNWGDDKANLMEEVFLDSGISVFDPYGAFNPNGKMMGSAFDTIKSINYSVIDRCDGVLAFLPGNVSTVGTVLEMQYARQANKLVVAVTDKPMSYLQGMASLVVNFRELSVARAFLMDNLTKDVD